MHRLGNVACLWLLAASAHAAAPDYVIRGLHVHLDFIEAVAVTESLGGVCDLKTLRRGKGETLSADCSFPPCAEEGGGDCHGSVATLDTGSQPLVRVGFQASAATRELMQIAIVFDGDPAEVAADLKRKFGPPYSDTTGSTEQSWSHSRRVHWKTDAEVMGLVNDINTILLSSKAVVERAEALPGDAADGD